MLNMLTENFGTIVVSAALLFIVYKIIKYLRKPGNSCAGCGNKGNCAHCATVKHIQDIDIKKL